MHWQLNAIHDATAVYSCLGTGAADACLRCQRNGPAELGHVGAVLLTCL